MKKILVFGLLLFLNVAPAYANEFLDVSEQDPHHDAIDYLSNVGIIHGQGSELQFDPNGFLNRAEWSVIMSRSLGEEPRADQFGFCFPDVSDEWFAPSVCFAQYKGWIKGYEAGPEAGFFIPTNNLNVAEVLVTLGRVKNWPIRNQVGDAWFSAALAYAQEANIVDPSWSFDHALTRAEAAEVLFRTIAVEHFSVNQYDPLLDELMLSGAVANPSSPSNPGASSFVTLRPFPDMPTKAMLAKGALYVPVLRFTLESDREVNLEKLTIRRVSLGRTSDLDQARLMINGHVFQERPFMNTSSSVEWSGLHQTLLPGQIFLIEMNVDFVAGAAPGLVYQFQIEPDQITFSENNTTVEGEKVVGQSFTMSSFASDKIVISNASSKLNIPYIETEGATIAKFTINAGEHDMLLKRIRFVNTGSINDEYLENFRLIAGSDEISFLQTADANVIDFFINDYLIEAGRDRTFSVQADILSPSIDSNIRLAIEYGKDVNAYDVQFGFGAQVDNQFNRQTAFCLGSNTIMCPKPGLRKHCSRDDIENKVRDCVPSEIGTSPAPAPTGSTPNLIFTLPTPPKIQIPLIFGFSRPSDVSAPTAAVESFITAQVRHGITEIPIYIGNVMPDGGNMSMSGKTPDFTAFMTMLSRIELAMSLPAKTFTVRPYIRASVTAGDASVYGNGPGKISLNNQTARQNIKILIQQIAAGQKYGLVGDRIREVTIDFEAITASNYDPNDLSPGDEGSVTQIAAFTQELKSGLGKKLGVYCSGFLSEKWFPSESTKPVGSPWSVSPQNYISEQDAELLFKSGVDVIEIGAYQIFPKQGGMGGSADPAVYGPLFTNYSSMLTTYYQALARISAKNPGLGLSSTKSLRIDIPVFSQTNNTTIVEAVGGLQDLIRTNVTPGILGATFDFTALDEQEKTLIFGAE